VRRWLLPAVLAVLSLSSGAYALSEPAVLAPAAAPVAAAPPTVGILSPRRVPELLSDTIAESRLRTGLDRVLADPAIGGARERSCLAVSQDGRRLYEARPDERLIPASNLKLLTGLAAVTKLGAESRFVTEVRAERAPQGGVVNGDLWLVGGGDPLLSTAAYAASFRNQPQVFTPLDALADSIKAAGITTVNGALRGDETRYDRQRYLPTWKPVYILDAESGPQSALTVNDNFVQYRPLKHIAATAPATHAASTLLALLQGRGVTVTGGAGEGTAPARGTVVAKVESPTVREVVGQMLRESDNLTAELLVKELGRRIAGEGSTAAGLRVMHEAVATTGLPADHMAAGDGSGLDRSGRASCSLLLKTIERDGPTGSITAGFPVAAKDGTLARRFEGHPAAGRLRAKTGSLDDVVGLSGWIDPPGNAADGPRLAFALLANGFGRDAVGRSLQESVAAVLARYPEAPPAAELAP
jgi:D-alanyl-D-alanine carboxypeptidase/D-alanyl-D-alanine-endopeptidase (penicillin-binding protein 4)